MRTHDPVVLPLSMEFKTKSQFNVQVIKDTRKTSEKWILEMKKEREKVKRSDCSVFCGYANLAELKTKTHNVVCDLIASSGEE